MANNEYINKVVFGNDTLVDLTNDSVEASNLLEGETAHDRSGSPITGTAKQGHVIKDADGTSMTQRQNLQFDGDVTVTDDSANNRTKVTVSGGGHTIWNRIKTALTQHSKLWFKDATVSDVSADGASAVEVITSVSESDFDNLPTDGTADGLYEMNSSNVTPLMSDNIGYGSGTVKDALDDLGANQTPDTDVTIGIACTAFQSSANQGYIVGVQLPFLMKNTNYVWKSSDLTIANVGSTGKSTTYADLYDKTRNSFRFFTSASSANAYEARFIQGTITLTYKAD